MDIVIYSIPGCKYCVHAKALMERASLEYTMYTVGTDLNKNDLLKKYPLAHGFPYIIIDGEPIGGLTQTAKYLVDKGIVSSTKK
jgi:glutaredoxin